MAIKIPNKYTKNEINKAGQILSNTATQDTKSISWAEEVLENWRGRHAYPMNTFQATLRLKLRRFNGKSIVAQRLKRSPSIINKLQRFSSMELARMQDIGGIRAVVTNINDAIKLRHMYINTRFKHVLIKENNYIDLPKSSGYRGIHLVNKYNSKSVPEYNGLQLELQIRTKLQHLWATSVETVETFSGHSLKSSKGPKELLDFLSLVSASFSLTEKQKIVPGYESFTIEEINKKISLEAEKLDIIKRLKAFGIAAENITNDNKRGSYSIIKLNLEESSVEVQNYSQNMFEKANKDYSELEKNISQKNQVVLVSTSSIENLKKAYPNYFLDTHEFIRKLEQIIKNS